MFEHVMRNEEILNDILEKYWNEYKSHIGPFSDSSGAFHHHHCFLVSPSCLPVVSQLSPSSHGAGFISSCCSENSQIHADNRKLNKKEYQTKIYVLNVF